VGVISAQEEIAFVSFLLEKGADPNAKGVWRKSGG
jgi:hypothetical protein